MALQFAASRFIDSYVRLSCVQARLCVIRLAQTVCVTLSRLTLAHYARVGGISLVEMNLLEKEFLNVIDWRLMVRAYTLRLTCRLRPP